MNTNFYQVPKEAVKSLDGTELRVYIIMLDQYKMFTKNSKDYFRSYEALAEDCGCCVRNVKYAVKSLISKGWIEKRKGGRRGSSNLANIYIVNESNTGVTVNDDSAKSCTGESAKIIKMTVQNYAHMTVQNIAHQLRHDLTNNLTYL